jgi:hypothetical protein
MSKKRMMSKQQRLYYESANKERVRQELAEFVKQEKQIDKSDTYKPYNPHESSYYT